jgi:hypothetical protein
MKRIVLFAVLLTAAFAFAAVGSAGNGKETHFGPFASTSPDGGSCGNDWATDTFNRDFKVKDNGDGTFTVKEEFKDGSFKTIAGLSPGSCEPDSNHGTLVNGGVTGTMHGDLQGTVTGGTFNPAGCDGAGAAICASSTTGFIAQVFPGGTFTTTGFKFEYSAGDQGLAFHHWEDKGDKTTVNDVFKGDIANS